MAEDEKDFPEHLRTIQFTLLALCLGLVVVITSPSTNSASAAYRQISDIEEIASHWDYRIFDEEVERQYRDQKLAEWQTPMSPHWSESSLPTAIQIMNSVGYKQVYDVKFSHPWLILPPDNANSVFLGRGSIIIQAHGVKVDPAGPGHIKFDDDFSFMSADDQFLQTSGFYTIAPSTVAEFKSFWDSLMVSHITLAPGPPSLSEVLASDPMNMRQNEFPPSGEDVAKAMEFRYVQTVAVNPSRAQGDPLKFILVKLSPADIEMFKNKKISNGRGWGATHGVGFLMAYVAAPWGWDDAERIIVPMPFTFLSDIKKSEALPLNLQGALVAHYPATWRYGRFEDAFRELDAITKDFQDISLEATQRIVRSESERSRDAFEAFGVKFPIETTASWGILLLLGTQVYFWLHLSEYRKIRIVAASPIAWIGNYSSASARILFLLTSCIIPVSVTIFVVIRARLHILGACAVVLSCLFAFRTAFDRKQIESAYHTAEALLGRLKLRGQ